MAIDNYIVIKPPAPQLLAYASEEGLGNIAVIAWWHAINGILTARWTNRCSRIVVRCSRVGCVVVICIVIFLAVFLDGGECRPSEHVHIEGSNSSAAEQVQHPPWFLAETTSAETNAPSGRQQLGPSPTGR
eukprot:CAMPEP_0119422372 /NCGR_PEP_ID=MMETSP1335-20130426/28065_1 /TAXON_ID=259385 /ORGANISM="Chrysoculter rhomboideus, Strain RCC1486" /LENGTH=130 /DNA_ID=CAMNT_0007447821 /DNA_START=60 /DNA_END=448 /DNA_ORIENTATION=-